MRYKKPNTEGIDIVSKDFLQKIVAGLVLLPFAVLYPSISYSFQKTNSLGQPDSLKTETDIGIVKFDTPSDTVFLYLDGNYDKLISLTDNKSLKLKKGFHNFFLFGRTFPERKLYLQVLKGDTSRVPLITPRNLDTESEAENRWAAYARLKWDANLIIETDSKTSVWINGNPHDTTFVKENLPAGNYRVTFKNINGKSKTKLVTVQKHRLTHLAYFFLPSKKVSRSLSILPGTAQMYKRQYLKGSALIALTGLSIGLAISNHSKFNSKSKEFEVLYKGYQTITNEAQAFEYGNRLDDLESTIKEHEKRRNLFWVAAAVLYALNIFDAFKKPKNGFQRTDTIEPFKGLGANVSNGNLGFSLTLEF